MGRNGLRWGEGREEPGEKHSHNAHPQQERTEQEKGFSGRKRARAESVD